MTRNIDPFKIDLLIPSSEDLRGVRPVKVMDIMEGATKNFHPDGLFSADIFGKVGEERRSRTFAYINFNIPIFHPLIYKVLCDLKELYGSIMQGREYAIFDKETGDFIKSNIAEGETGFAFFAKHFPNLKFEKRKSISRTVYIQFIEKYRSNPWISQLVVMPAGLRDYMVDETGKPSEDEINAMYRSIMSVSATMENLSIKNNPEFVDSARANLQSKVLDLYRYLISLLVGKHKLIQGSFLSRKVSDTTRNVISAYIPNVMRYGDSSSIDPNTTVIGLYQHLRNLLPLVVYNIRTKYMPMVFTGANTDMMVVDTKTLKSKRVPFIPKEFNTWMTYEGIEKVCDRFSQEAMRHYPVMIGDSYAALIYRGPDNTFKVFGGIDELPDGFDKKFVTPLTMAELLYLSIFEAADDSYGFATRYPVTTYGSTYPTKFYLRTTIRGEARYMLDEGWNKTEVFARNIPINGLPFFNSMSPPVSRLARLGADYDGDTMSSYAVLTDEARAEVKALLSNKDHFLTLDNRMAFSLAGDNINLALKYLTA